MPRLAALVMLAHLAAGCTMFPGASSLEPETTASIPAQGSPFAPMLTSDDWTQAQPALNAALDPLKLGAPASWSNKANGIKGQFVSQGTAYVRNDQLCHAFTASVNLQGRSTTLLGVACRVGAGAWTVQKAKSWDGRV